MGRNAIETVLGAVVLAVAGLFMAFAYASADLHKVQGYEIHAYFPMVDGIKDGTDVKINGVKVGSVADMQLVTTPGPNMYKVDVKMTILPDIRLPTDTVALVASESLLGGKYLSLEVGVEDSLIKTDGSGRITQTQSPMRLDDLIGQLIYGSKRGEGNASGATPPAASSSSTTPSSPALSSSTTPSAPATPAASAATSPAPTALPSVAPAASTSTAASAASSGAVAPAHPAAQPAPPQEPSAEKPATPEAEPANQESPTPAMP